MKSANRHTAVVIAALLAVLACMCWASTSKAAESQLIQEKTLLARASLQTWLSTDKGHTVYVHVYGPSGTIVQRWINPCRANYPDPSDGLYIWVQLEECHKPGSHPFAIRYLSVSGPQRFRVRLTTSPF